MELFLIKYGLLAVFIASLVEADIIPVLAGVAAHRGYFDPALGIVAASLGALAGDCFWFYVGRYKTIQNSKVFLRIRPKAESLFQRVGMWQIPASHIIYGTRVATMTVFGAHGHSFSRFVVFDGVSCIVLTTLLFSLGFALSASASIILVHIRHVEVLLLVTVVLSGLIFRLVRKVAHRSLLSTPTGKDHL